MAAAAFALLQVQAPKLEELMNGALPTHAAPQAQISNWVFFKHIKEKFPKRFCYQFQNPSTPPIEKCLNFGATHNLD